MSTTVGKRSDRPGRFAALTALRDVFTNRNMRRLQLGWAGFIVADSAYAVGVAVVAFQVGGAPAVGIVMVCRFVPAAFATPVVTHLIEPYRGERVLAVTVAARAAVMAVLAAAAASDPSAATLYALTVADTIFMTAFRPVSATLLVSAARSPSELSAANSANAMTESVGDLVGPLVGAVLLAVTSASTVFVAAAILLLGAALQSARIRLAGQEAGVEEKGASSERRGFWLELRASIRLLGSVPSSAVVVGLFSVQALVRGMFMVLSVVVAIELLRTGDAGVGELQAAFGAGGLIGGVGTLALVGRRGLAKPFALGLTLCGPPIALIAILPHPVVALGLVGIFGAGRGLIYVAGMTMLQRMMDKEMLGRVFGLVQSLVVIATGVGAFLTPPLIAALGLRGALISVGVLMPFLVAVSWSRLAQIDARAPGRPVELAALRGVAIFGPLTPVALEQLAAATVSLSAAAGSDVIRQGDGGDRFYIVAEGVLDVYVDSRFVASLGPGGSFGEIALLRDLPRTATVRARTDVELYALERDDFLLALTGARSAATAAASVVDARLHTRPLDERLSDTDLAAALDGRATADVLRTVGAFAGLAPDRLAELALAASAVRAHRGADITRQGDYGDRFYVALEGSVAITVDGAPVATLEAGDSFGERALADAGPRTATAAALTPVTLLALDGAAFLRAAAAAAPAAEP